MSKLKELKKHLKPGCVYRRGQLAQWSRSVDRHLEELLREGTLQKLSQGVYHYPELTPFGKTPPRQDVLVKSFLKDDRFLLTSPNAYNALGVGTTQLYNVQTVYNHKRHGKITLGKQTFDFRVKPHFPTKPTVEFLLVDLVNNLGELAEDPVMVLDNVKQKMRHMEPPKLRRAVQRYGNAKTKKVLEEILSLTHA